ncbi:MAG: TetR/AcrR family transcriptional regulator [Chloroflexaceae bacterium]|jgi:TetR/AcrR family transcriptional regulator|nr:TetR/AcrR family transcriptional regulator [Chloroflexaceae bacterium]
MTTGRTRDSEGTRQRILAAAEAIFAQQGYDGARVDVIAAQANINKRMLYHYFTDKEGLYAAVLEAVGTRLLQRLAGAFAAAQQHDDLISGLRALLETYFDVVQTEPHYVKLIVFEAATDWRGLQAVETAHGGMAGGKSIDALLGYILPILERGVAEGKLRPDLDLLLLTTLFTMACRVYLLLIPRLQAFYSEPLGSPERLAWARGQIVDMVLHGITTRSPVA